MMASEDQQQEGWKRLLSSFSKTEIADLGGANSLQSLHRKAYSKVYRNQMDQRTFFLISVFAWMDSCNWLEGDAATGRVSVDLPSVIEGLARTESMASWMIPFATNIPNLGRAFDPKQAWISFWMAYYDQCNEPAEDGPPKAKRIRLASSTNVTFNAQDSKHGLPCTLLMIALLYNQSSAIIHDWDQFHELVFQSLSPRFKYTKEYSKAGLFLFGLHCIRSDNKIAGLNPLGLFQKYLISLGFSPLTDAILQVYLEQHEGLNKYTLRASICDNLLESIYGSEDMDDASEVQLINACSTFLSQESAKRYLAGLSSPSSSGASRKRDRPSEIPPKIWSPGYPVLIQAELYLQQQREEEAIELASALESTTGLDPVIVDEGWLTIFQYFFNQGDMFLDRNFVNSPEYCRKRKLLFFAAGEMGSLGRETLFTFYLDLHKEMLASPFATPDEVHYVETACQQTLLRLIIKACGMRSANTVDYFFSKTSHQWPSLVPPGDSHQINLEQWVADFLIRIPEIPESLKIIDGSGKVDLRRFMPLLQNSTEESEVEEPILIEPEEPALRLLQDSPAPSGTAPSALPPLATMKQPEPFQKETLALSAARGISLLLAAKVPADEAGDDDEEEEEEVDGVSTELDKSAMGELSYGNLNATMSTQYDDNYEEQESEEEIPRADEFADEGNQEEKSGDSDVIVLDDTSEEEEEEQGVDEVRPDTIQDEEEEEEEDDYDVASTGDVYDEDDSEADVVASPLVPQQDEEDSRSDDNDEDVSSEEEEDDDDGDDNDNDGAAAAAAVVASSDAPGGQFDDVGAEDMEDVEVVEVVDSSPEKASLGIEGKESVANLSTENKAADSDETEEMDNDDDDQERPAARPDPYDTTDDEGDEKGTGAANKAAAEIRRADAMAASTEYTSQIEEGYEPEDTHGYTEEEVSEAIHTEDEEEDRRKKEEANRATVQEEPVPIVPVKPIDHKVVGSSDDMDADDEHTEQEEDLGAESSELEEHGDGQTPVKKYSPEPARSRGDTTTLWQYAQTAQRQHEETLMQDGKGKSVGFEEGTKKGDDDESKKRSNKSDDSDYDGGEVGTESNTVYTTETADVDPELPKEDSEDDMTEEMNGPEDAEENDAPVEKSKDPSALDETMEEEDNEIEEKTGNTEVEVPASGEKDIGEGLIAAASDADKEAATLDKADDGVSIVAENGIFSDGKIPEDVQDPQNDQEEPSEAAEDAETAEDYVASAANDEDEAFAKDEMLAVKLIETAEDDPVSTIDEVEAPSPPAEMMPSEITETIDEAEAAAQVTMLPSEITEPNDGVETTGQVEMPPNETTETEIAEEDPVSTTIDEVEAPLPPAEMLPSEITETIDEAEAATQVTMLPSEITEPNDGVETTEQVEMPPTETESETGEDDLVSKVDAPAEEANEEASEKDAEASSEANEEDAANAEDPEEVENEVEIVVNETSEDPESKSPNSFGDEIEAAVYIEPVAASNHEENNGSADPADDDQADEAVPVEEEIEDTEGQMVGTKTNVAELEMMDVAEGDHDQVAMADDEAQEDKMVEDEDDVQMGDIAAADAMQVDDEARSTDDIEMQSYVADSEVDADMVEDALEKMVDVPMIDTSNLAEKETIDETMNEQSMEEVVAAAPAVAEPEEDEEEHDQAVAEPEEDEEQEDDQEDEKETNQEQQAESEEEDEKEAADDEKSDEEEAEEEAESEQKETAQPPGRITRRSSRSVASKDTADEESVPSAARRSTRATRAATATSPARSTRSTRSKASKDSTVISTTRSTRRSSRAKVEPPNVEENEDSDQDDRPEVIMTTVMDDEEKDTKLHEDEEAGDTKPDEDEESVATEASHTSSKRSRSTRSTRSKKAAEQSAEDDDDVGTKSARSSRRNTRSRKAKDDPGEEEEESSDEEDAKEKEEEEAPKRRTTRRSSRSAKTEASDDEEDGQSVASTASRPRRSTRGTKKPPLPDIPEDEAVSVASTVTSRTRRSTRGSDKKAAEESAEEDDEQSVASTASRTRRSTRGAKKRKADDSEDETQSVASTASRTRRSTRSRKKAAANEEEDDSEDEAQSVASTVSRTRRSTRGRKKATEENEDEEEEEETQSVTSTASRTRRSTRGSKKKEEDASSPARRTRSSKVPARKTRSRK